MRAVGHPGDDRTMNVFAVERFLVGWSREEIDDLIGRTADAAGRMEADDVHYLESIVVPSDETCLSLYRAPDAAAVRAANQRCNLPFDRVLAATLAVQA